MGQYVEKNRGYVKEADRGGVGGGGVGDHRGGHREGRVMGCHRVIDRGPVDVV